MMVVNVTCAHASIRTRTAAKTHTHTYTHARARAHTHMHTPLDTLGRLNSIGPVGWAEVLAAVRGCTKLASVDGVAVGGLYAGGLETFKVVDKISTELPEQQENSDDDNWSKPSFDDDTGFELFEMCMESKNDSWSEHSSEDLKDTGDAGLALAVVPYLELSASCLTSLNLRHAPANSQPPFHIATEPTQLLRELLL